MKHFLALLLVLCRSADGCAQSTKDILYIFYPNPSSAATPDEVGAYPHCSILYADISSFKISSTLTGNQFNVYLQGVKSASQRGSPGVKIAREGRQPYLQFRISPFFPDSNLVGVFHIDLTDGSPGVVVVFYFAGGISDNIANKLSQSVKDTLLFLLSIHTDDQAAAEAVLALHVKWHLGNAGNHIEQHQPVESLTAFNPNFLVIGVENDQLKELQFPDEHGFVKIFNGGLIVKRKSNQKEQTPPVAIDSSISNVKWVKRGDRITALHTDVESTSPSLRKNKVLPEAPPEASETFQTGVEFPVQSSEFPYAGVLTDPKSEIKYFVFDFSKSVKEDVSIREHRPTNQQEVPFHADFAVAAIIDLVRITRALENPIQYNYPTESVSGFPWFSRISSAKSQSVSFSKDSLQLEQPSGLLRILYSKRLSRLGTLKEDSGGAAQAAVTMGVIGASAQLRDNLIKALEEAMKKLD